MRPQVAGADGLPHSTTRGLHSLLDRMVCSVLVRLSVDYGVKSKSKVAARACRRVAAVDVVAHNTDPGLRSGSERLGFLILGRLPLGYGAKSDKLRLLVSFAKTKLFGTDKTVAALMTKVFSLPLKVLWSGTSAASATIAA